MGRLESTGPAASLLIVFPLAVPSAGLNFPRC